jgi:hypothetical protein
MKKLPLLLAVACVVAACSTTPPEIKGAYKMMSQNVKADTVDQTNTNPQLKIYTEQYMMYSGYSPADSVSSFGIGTYTLDGDAVNESVFYSAADTTSDAATYPYKLAIQRTDKGYKQVIDGMTADDGQKFVLTEEYETVSSPATSALDGAWQMTSGYFVNAKKDTFKFPMEAARQYKVHYAGNFMFGQNWTDSLKVVHTGMGFGTFEMTGDDQSKETIQTSAWPAIVGQTFNLALKFNGPDEYTQTIVSEDGSSTTETYRRLGK